MTQPACEPSEVLWAESPRGSPQLPHLLLVAARKCLFRIQTLHTFGKFVLPATAACEQPSQFFRAGVQLRGAIGALTNSRPPSPGEGTDGTTHVGRPRGRKTAGVPLPPSLRAVWRKLWCRALHKALTPVHAKWEAVTGPVCVKCVSIPEAGVRAK